MRVNVIARPAIDRAIERHANATSWLNAWWKTARTQQWRNLLQVQDVYPSIDQLGSCLIFNVLGNRYRLIVGVRFATEARGGTLFVKHFLTHAQYDKGAWKKDCTHDG